MTHWHVQRHAGDDDVFVTGALVDAFDYASTELWRMAEFEHESISACGDSGDFEEAYRAYQRAERYNGLAQQAAIIYQQGTLPTAERASLYQNEPEQGPRWHVAAGHVLEAISAKGPNGFAIWECAPIDETAQAFAENVRTCAVILRNYPTNADDARTRLTALGVDPAVLEAAWQEHMALLGVLIAKAFPDES